MTLIYGVLQESAPALLDTCNLAMKALRELIRVGVATTDAPNPLEY